MGPKKVTSPAFPPSEAGLTRSKSRSACSRGVMLLRSVVAVPPGIPAGAAPARRPARRRHAPSGGRKTWQKRAPAVSGAAQTEQLAPARAAPQLLQNLPDVSLPQLGHFMQGSWWEGESK